jgi:type IV pilus assembly protein PilZ
MELGGRRVVRSRSAMADVKKPEHAPPGAPADAPRTASDWEDRRESPRHAITLRVDYKRMNTFFADYAKNISKGGTFIRTNKPLDVGTEFVFVLSIPEKAEHLQLRGEVMWTVDEAQASAERAPGMGIRFRFAADSERLALEKFVQKLMAAELGSNVAAKLLGKG